MTLKIPFAVYGPGSTSHSTYSEYFLINLISSSEIPISWAVKYVPPSLFRNFEYSWRICFLSDIFLPHVFCQQGQQATCILSYVFCQQGQQATCILSYVSCNMHLVSCQMKFCHIYLVKCALLARPASHMYLVMCIL